jgi:hypothetical protein
MRDSVEDWTARDMAGTGYFTGCDGMIFAKKYRMDCSSTTECVRIAVNIPQVACWSQAWMR